MGQPLPTAYRLPGVLGLARGQAIAEKACMDISPPPQGSAAAPFKPISAIEPPHSAWQAIARGAQGRCPRCAQGRLFRKYLKPVAQCSACGQDWSLERADDFPAYIAILLTGHVMAPILVAINASWDLSTLAFEALMIPLVILSVLLFLQPSKGAVIAMQWWHGLHGFCRDR